MEAHAIYDESETQHVEEVVDDSGGDRLSAEAPQIYNEPIYELTEENLSDRQTPAKASPRVFTGVQEKKLMLIVTIEIGNGEQEELSIFEGDDIQVRAMEFCEKHGIDPYFKEPISYLIEEKITKAKQLQMERSGSFDNSDEGPENEVPLSSGHPFSQETSPEKQIIDIEPIVEEENEQDTTKNYLSQDQREESPEEPEEMESESEGFIRIDPREQSRQTYEEEPKF